jgi:predicted amidohydrolase YtcJ
MAPLRPLLLLLALASPALAALPADLVLRGGTVHTADIAHPRAQAIAVRGNTIVAVGTDADVSALVGPRTRVVELAGRAVFPGFVESHGHFISMGELKLNLDLVGTQSWAEVVDRVKAAAKTRAPGEWVVGFGWHEGKWARAAPGAVRGFPTNADLNAAAPEIPVVLERADGHAVIVNDAALRVAGITAATKPPEGGEIIRTAAGIATGVLVDHAADLVHAPPLTAAQMKRALELAEREALSNGITMFVDAGASPEALALYRAEADRGALPLRLYAMVDGFPALQSFGAPVIDAGHGFLTIRSVKLHADGALGSRGAALLEPYSDDPGNSGFFTTSPETVLATARYGLAHGFQVSVHAIGDRTNRMVLDQFETAFREAGVPIRAGGTEGLPPVLEGSPGSSRRTVNDPRFRMEHAQILDAQDIPRFAKLGVIASMQGIHATSDRPWAANRLGMARVTEGAYVWQKLLRSGARIVNGTDVPVEDVSPLRCFYASITRQDETGQPRAGFDPDQRMTREEALRSYTADAAFATFTEDRQGTIAVGKRADLTVLSQDIMRVAPRAILDTRVAYTIVDGVVRLRRPD